jgi:SulP family sulfate permease
MSRIDRRPALDYALNPKNEHLVLRGLIAAAPGVGVLRRYHRAWLRPDLFAGVAVAAYLVPQVMAYSAIVNVPPVVGLWTALAALVVYAVMGCSRVLSVGPESTVALMAGTAVAPLAHGDQTRAMALTAALSLIVAAWCVIARMARLGVIADLLSQPLLVGYLAGGAVLMVVGQLGKMTGTHVGGESIMEQIQSFVSVVGHTHVTTLLVGAGTLALLVAIHVLRPRWPAPLIAVATATALCAFTGLGKHGVAVVGKVPTGLPVPHLPGVTWDDVQTLLIVGLGVAVVAYGDNTLIARGFPVATEDGEGRDVLDPQQELVALAGVHVVVGLVGGFPASSSGSRTALALASNARSQLYSLVSAACVLITLFVAGPLIANLPQASLGAVVFYAASKLVSWQEFVRLVKFRPNELVLALAATLGTVLFGILVGVGVAIGLSLLEMAQRLARPHEGVLGRVPGLAGMHDVDDYPDAQTLPGLIVYRYDAPLFFANVGDLRRRALLVVDQENTAFPDYRVRWFVLNVEANVEIDITAADGLRDLYDDLAEQGVRLGLARVKHDLLVPLERAGLTELIGEEMLFPTLPVAEEAYLAWAAANPWVPPSEAASSEASSSRATVSETPSSQASSSQASSSQASSSPVASGIETGEHLP